MSDTSKESYRRGYKDGEWDRETGVDTQWNMLGMPGKWDSDLWYWDGYHDGRHEWRHKYPEQEVWE